MLDLNFDLSGLTGLTTVLEPPQQPPTQPSLVQQSIPKSSPATSRQPVYIDIETIPDESRRHLFGLDEPVEVREFSNPSDEVPTLIEKSVAQIQEIVAAYNPTEEWLVKLEAFEKLQKKPRDGVLKIVKTIRLSRELGNGEEAEAAKVKKMSVTPEYLKVVAIGIAIGQNAPIGFVVNDHLGGAIDEAELIAWFWEQAQSASSIVGYNILGFDLPALFVRSAIIGVSPTRQFDSKPWGTDVIDLMVKRWPKGGQMRMKDVGKLYGIDPDAGDMEGSQVYETFKTEPGKLVDYVKSDVALTQRLHGIWKGFFC